MQPPGTHITPRVGVEAGTLQADRGRRGSFSPDGRPSRPRPDAWWPGCWWRLYAPPPSAGWASRAHSTARREGRRTHADAARRLRAVCPGVAKGPIPGPLCQTAVIPLPEQADLVRSVYMSAVGMRPPSCASAGCISARQVGAPGLLLLPSHPRLSAASRRRTLVSCSAQVCCV